MKSITKKDLIFWIISGTIIIGLLWAVLISRDLVKEKEEILKQFEFEMHKTMPETVFRNKKVVMIIAFRDFRDAEYFVPKEILEKAGIEVKTASNKMGTAIGADGGDTNVDLLVSQIKVSDFDAIIFVGGPGCLDALDNEDSYKVAKEAVSQNKVLAAICISPVILAKAGVLEGKRATCWTDPLGSQAKILKEKGAIFEKKPVVVDGKIITANGPGAAEEFGKTIVEILTKE
jgi:protease I